MYIGSYGIPLLISDKKAIHRIVRHLLTNSIDFCDRTKDLKYIEIIISNTENEIQISIEDNGLGIAEKEQQLIFTMFYSTEKEDISNGLGLYETNEAVKKLGGTLTATSQKGEGTTMKVSIPLNKKEQN